MIELAPPSARKSHFDMAIPLINIVLLLLIFLMLTGILRSADPIELTPAQTDSEANDTTESVPIVYMAANGDMRFNDAVQEADILQQIAAQAQLGTLEQLSVKADGKANMTALLAFIRKVRENGVGKVDLIVEQRQ